MIEDDDNIEALIGRARQYAALSVEFSPLVAIRTSFGDQPVDPPVAARVMGALRADCTTAADGERWIMRQSPRDRVLRGLGPDILAAAESWNLPTDTLASMMRGALAADPGTTSRAVQALLDDPSPDFGRVEAMTRVLELAGDATGEARAKLAALQGQLNRLHTLRQSDAALAQGYFGNEALRKRLGAWAETPVDTRIARAIYIRGIPGVGKSFLLTKLVQEARESSNPIVLWLDFDRRGLNLVEPEGLTMELARQLGNELPGSAAELLHLRVREAAENAAYSNKRGRGSLPYALVQAMGDAVRASGRHVLLILDTLEVLASQGQTHPQRLFDYLDDLLSLGVAPIAIIAAGRGDALAGLGSRRVAEVVPLAGLPERVARLMLDKLAAPADAVAPILALAKGNPLLLRLAAKLARDGGAAAVALTEVEGKTPEVAGGYLYRAILSRIENDRLSEIANLGLVLERVDAGTIAEVIGPALGMQIDAAEAAVLLDQLAAHHWLVEREDGGWVRHRSDIRQVVLALLYADRPDQVAAVNRAAATYLADRDPVAALYHRLRGLGPDEAVPRIDRALAAQFGEAMIGELETRAADAVLQARGDVSRSGREGPSATGAGQEQIEAGASPINKGTAPPAPQITATDLNDMRNLLVKGDILEAEGLYRAKFARIEDAASEPGLAGLCHCWLSGRWSRALRLYRQLEASDFAYVAWMNVRATKGGARTLEASGFGPGASQEAQSLVRFVLLEMRAEFAFDELVAEFERDDAALRHAQLAYRDTKALRLTEGALAYALLAENRPHTISGGWRDAVGSAGLGMQSASDMEFCLRDAMALRERLGLPADIAQRAPWDIAACLNPYAAPAAMLLSLKQSPLLGRYVQAVTEHFHGVADTLFGEALGDKMTAEALLSRREVLVEQLGGLGATADWLGAFAFFNPIPNLPLLARRAELWRRSAAGQWTYGANAPAGWVDAGEDFDCGTQAWLDRLMAMPDPAEEAARQLLFWHDPASVGGDAAAPMKPRSIAKLARALLRAREAARRTKGDPQTGAVRALQAGGLGRAIAVPVAVLSTVSRKSARQAEWRKRLAAACLGELEHILGED